MLVSNADSDCNLNLQSSGPAVSSVAAAHSEPSTTSTNVSVNDLTPVIAHAQHDTPINIAMTQAPEEYIDSLDTAGYGAPSVQPLKRTSEPLGKRAKAKLKSLKERLRKPRTSASASVTPADDQMTDFQMHSPSGISTPDTEAVAAPISSSLPDIIKPAASQVNGAPINEIAERPTTDALPDAPSFACRISSYDQASNLSDTEDDAESFTLSPFNTGPVPASVTAYIDALKEEADALILTIREQQHHHRSFSKAEPDQFVQNVGTDDEVFVGQPQVYVPDSVKAWVFAVEEEDMIAQTLLSEEQDERVIIQEAMKTRIKELQDELRAKVTYGVDQHTQHQHMQKSFQYILNFILWEGFDDHERADLLTAKNGYGLCGPKGVKSAYQKIVREREEKAKSQLMVALGHLGVAFTKIDELHKENEALSSELGEVKYDTDKLTTDYDGTLDQINEIAQNLGVKEEGTEALISIDEHINHLEAQNTGLKAKVDDLKNTISLLQDKNEVNAELVYLKNQIKQLSKEKEDTENDAHRSYIANERLKASEATLQGSEAALKKQLSTLQQMANQAPATDALHKRLKSLQKENASLKIQVKEKDSLREQVTQLQNSLAESIAGPARALESDLAPTFEHGFAFGTARAAGPKHQPTSFAARQNVKRAQPVDFKFGQAHVADAQATPFQVDLGFGAVAGEK